MATEKKKVTLFPDAHSLAILSATADTAGINGALRRYSGSIVQASRELESVLVRAEWNYLADCLNGCADLWDYAETPLSSLTLIRAEAHDAHRLNRTGGKWFGETKKAGDKGAAELGQKLDAMTALHGDAILCAVRHFWEHPGIDHTVESWWTVEHRVRAAAKGRAEA